MDWALLWVFRWLCGLPWLLLIYDIMCQYCVNVRRRFQGSPFLEWPSTLTTFVGAIGQFHIHGHKSSCFPRYSVNFVQGAGVQDGEILETLWAGIEGVSNSILGMTASHRREVLDDQMNDSNWMKTTRIGGPLSRFLILQPIGSFDNGNFRYTNHSAQTLMRKWIRVCEQLPRARKVFAEQAVVGEKNVKEWTALAKEADKQRAKSVEALDIYDVEKSPCKSCL